jgi:hypothetical protein
MWRDYCFFLQSDLVIEFAYPNGSFPCLVLTSSPLLFPIACLVVFPVQPPQLVTYNDAGIRPALTVRVDEPNPDPCQLDTRNVCPPALSFENPIPIDLAA